MRLLPIPRPASGCSSVQPSHKLPQWRPARHGLDAGTTTVPSTPMCDRSLRTSRSTEVRIPRHVAANDRDSRLAQSFSQPDADHARRQMRSDSNRPKILGSTNAESMPQAGRGCRPMSIEADFPPFPPATRMRARCYRGAWRVRHLRLSAGTARTSVLVCRIVPA